jgi:hypothetical protein
MTMEDNNHYKVSLPLPTAGECIFFLRGDFTVQKLLNDLQKEDQSIKEACLKLGTLPSFVFVTVLNTLSLKLSLTL